MPEYVGSGNRKRVRVNEASAANAGTGADEDVTQQSQTKDAMAKELRHPDRAPEVPVGERKILGGEPLPRLENGNSIALLRQAKGGDRAAKPRADDQDGGARARPDRLLEGRQGRSGRGVRPRTRPAAAGGPGEKPPRPPVIARPSAIQPRFGRASTCAQASHEVRNWEPAGPCS